MNSRFIGVVILSATLVLAACSGKTPTTGPTTGESVNAQSGEPQNSVNSAQILGTKSDDQGAVAVEITPENFSHPGDTLIFDVSMNTHSVDLSMDLAKLAVLSTDTGKSVQATLWDAPRGGHHLEGKLSFPSMLDGKNLLDGAKSITLTITNVDAPTRTFTWQFPS